jgi:hypothetical protein
MNGDETGVDCGGSQCLPCTANCVTVADAGIAEANQPYALVVRLLVQVLF